MKAEARIECLRLGGGKLEIQKIYHTNFEKKKENYINSLICSKR